MWKLALLSSLVSLSVYAKDRTGAVDEAQTAENCATAVSSDEGCRKENYPAGNECLSPDTIKRYETATRKSWEKVQKLAASPNTIGNSMDVVHSSLISSPSVYSEKAAGSLWMEPDAKKIADQLVGKKFVNLQNCSEWKNQLVKNKENAIPRGAILIYEPKSKDEFVADWVKAGMTKDDAEDMFKGPSGMEAQFRMKTPSGCVGAAHFLTKSERESIDKVPEDQQNVVRSMLRSKAAEEHVKKHECLSNPGYKLTGIYVKNVN